jgi:hypothetical protein
MKKLFSITFASLFLVCCPNRPGDLVKKTFVNFLNLSIYNEKMYSSISDSAKKQLTQQLNEISNHFKIKDSIADVNYQISHRIYFQEMNKLDPRDTCFKRKLKQYDENEEKAMSNLIALNRQSLNDRQAMKNEVQENYETALKKARRRYP